MKRACRIGGGVLILVGTIWFLQGVGILPGSFMTGQMRWAVNGAVAFGTGFVLLWAARR